MSSSVRGPATIITIASVVFIVAGVVVWFTTPSTDASFGWFAYTSIAEISFIGPFFLHGQRLLAAGLAVVGLILAGVALGFRWGQGVGRLETLAGPDPFSHPTA